MASDGQAEAETTELEPKHFDIRFHAWLDVAQNTHGVRHDDYRQYHGYCTRRLARLRHSDKSAKRFMIHSAKYQGKPATGAADGGKSKNSGKSKSGQQRNMHAYCSISQQHAEEIHSKPLQQDVLLWISFVQAERAWAQACELKQQHPNPTAKQRSHVVRRLKKAQSYAQELHGLATSQEGNVTALTLLEIQAYVSWIKATFALERTQYKAACVEYANAMRFCFDLAQPIENEAKENSNNSASAIDENRAFLERKEFFMNRAETVLRPLFRYCQYECKESSGEGDDAELPQEPVAPGSERSAATDADSSLAIDFRGHTLVVDHHKDLRVVLLKLSSLDAAGISSDVGKSAGDDGEAKTDDSANAKASATDGKQEAQFLSLLSVLDDALTLSQAQIQSLTSGTNTAKLQQWKLWKSYFEYQKVRAVSQHTSGLLQTVDRTAHAERAHIYQSLYQYANSLLSLEQHPEDGGDEDEFALQAMANCYRLRAFKTYHMGMHYYEHRQQHPQALALLRHSQQLTKRALEEIAACDEDMENSEKHMNELETLLDEQLAGGVAAVESALAMNALLSGRTSSSSSGAANSNRCLLQRLADMDAGPMLVDVPPMTLPIPCKGVFYDLAYDHATHYSDAADHIQQYIDAHLVEESSRQQDGASAGGFFSGWFGGSSSQ